MKSINSSGRSWARREWKQTDPSGVFCAHKAAAVLPSSRTFHVLSGVMPAAERSFGVSICRRKKKNLDQIWEEKTWGEGDCLN